MESKQDPRINLFLISMNTWENIKKLIDGCKSTDPNFDFNKEAHVNDGIIKTVDYDNEWFYVIKLNDADISIIVKCLSKYVPGIQPQHCEWDTRTETIAINIGIYSSNLSFTKFLDSISNRTINKEMNNGN